MTQQIVIDENSMNLARFFPEWNELNVDDGTYLKFSDDDYQISNDPFSFQFRHNYKNPAYLNKKIYQTTKTLEELKIDRSKFKSYIGAMYPLLSAGDTDMYSSTIRYDFLNASGSTLGTIQLTPDDMGWVNPVRISASQLHSIRCTIAAATNGEIRSIQLGIAAQSSSSPGVVDYEPAFKFVNITSYKKQFFYQNSDGTWPATPQSQEIVDNIDSGTSVNLSYYDKLPTLSSDVGEYIYDSSQSVESAIVQADGSTVLKAYFKISDIEADSLIVSLGQLKGYNDFIKSGVDNVSLFDNINAVTIGQASHTIRGTELSQEASSTPITLKQLRIMSASIAENK